MKHATEKFGEKRNGKSQQFSKFSTENSNIWYKNVTFCWDKKRHKSEKAHKMSEYKIS